MMLKLVCHLYLNNTKTSHMIKNYSLYMYALNYASMSIPLKRKSAFLRCESLFMFWFSAYTTMVTWFLSHYNVNINILPHSKLLQFVWKFNSFRISFREYYHIHVTNWFLKFSYFWQIKWHTVFKSMEILQTGHLFQHSTPMHGNIW